MKLATITLLVAVLLGGCDSSTPTSAVVARWQPGGPGRGLGTGPGSAQPR